MAVNEFIIVIFIVSKNTICSCSLFLSIKQTGPCTTVARLCWHQKKVSSDSLVKMTLWTFVEAHITNIEMKHDALMKIAVNMHSLFGPIWQIFLPVYHRPSKRASCFISILENLASTKVHRAIVISEMLGTFFWFQHRLAIAV